MSSPSESITLKNKNEKTSLKKKLDQLQKANKADIRMHNTIEHRFRARFGHLDNNQDIQELFKLLCTNGELDTHKVLCLHTLCAHPGEVIKPEKGTKKIMNFLGSTTALRTPTEKLIQRSHYGCFTASSSLPIYVLNVNQNKSKPSRGYNQKRFSNDCCIRDGRLATRLVINKKITRLVYTVLEALQRCNPAKLLYIIRVAQNSNHINDILHRPELEPFLKSLMNFYLLLSPESFCLTKPFVCGVHIKIQNASTTLVELVTKIRRSVLKDSLNTHMITTESKMDLLNRKPSNENLPNRRHKSFNASKIAEMLGSFDKKSLAGTLNEDRFIALVSQSTQYLNFRINEEMARVHDECLKVKKDKQLKRRLCKVIPAKKDMTLANENRRSSYLLRKAKNYAQYYGYKSSESSSQVVDNLNLAKIKHEISVKENSKRVKKFLDEPLF